MRKKVPDVQVRYTSSSPRAGQGSCFCRLGRPVSKSVGRSVGECHAQACRCIHTVGYVCPTSTRHLTSVRAMVQAVVAAGFPNSLARDCQGAGNWRDRRCEGLQRSESCARPVSGRFALCHARPTSHAVCSTTNIIWSTFEVDHVC